MLISYRWLTEYVATHTKPLELGERFRMTSSELDDFRDYSAELEKIVVGRIESLSKHPQADRLHITQVDCGDKTIQIVCGGTNLREGMHVAVALPGSVVHPLQGEPFCIGESTIRGEKSFGMICAPQEIGIALPEHNHDIWDLDTLNLALKPGTLLAKALDLDDAVLQLEVTPNRSDLLSHLGLAREVAAFEHRKLLEPAIASLSNAADTTAAKVIIDPSAGCERFSALLFKVDNLSQSPWWLQRRLLLCNIRPINVIVDVTNYVMLELGQPLHAYDAEVLTNGKNIELTIRAAKANESLSLLDGSQRELASGDIIITDTKGTIVDLCGIMGGKSSAIQPSTTQVLLEAAHFEPGQIRRTSRRLGLRSEASSRFEKGVDAELTVTALKRAAELWQQLGAAHPISAILDERRGGHADTPTIELEFTHLHDVLGVRIPPHEAKVTLQQLGFSIRSISKAKLSCSPPSWRKDVRIAEDVIEEVGRIWGFERIPTSLPLGAVKAPQRNRQFTVRNAIRAGFSALGAYEVLHAPFTSPARLMKAGLSKQALALANPLSSNDTHLVPSHLPLLLESVSEVNAAEEELTLFEVGHVFSADHSEEERFSILLRSSKLSHEELVAKAKQYVAAAEAIAKNTARAEILVIPEAVIADYKIRRGRNIVFCSFTTKELYNAPQQHFFASLPTFPVTTRDLTISVPESTPWQHIEDAVSGVHTDILYAWEHVTTYRGKDTATKALTMRFRYTSLEKTLTEEEINAAAAAIEAALAPFKA